MKEFTCLQLIFWLEHSIIRTTFANYNDRYLLLPKVLLNLFYLLSRQQKVDFSLPQAEKEFRTHFCRVQLSVKEKNNFLYF